MNISRSTRKRRAFRIREKYADEIERKGMLSVADEKHLVKTCSLGITGLVGKGATKARYKATYRAGKNDAYAGGSYIWTKQDRWHRSPSWFIKQK
jgi:hypothetical protein